MNDLLLRRAIRAVLLGAFLALWTTPVVLLLRVSPGIIAGGLAIGSIVAGIVRRRARARDHGERAPLAPVLLVAAAVLGGVHLSGAVGPLISPRGDLAIDVEASVHPAEEENGRVLSYSIDVISRDDRPAGGRSFSVDGRSHRGVLLYGMLSRIRGGQGELLPMPTAAVHGTDSSHRIVYADPPDITVSPTEWEWSTEFRSDATVVGVLTGGGSGSGDLSGGARIELRYRVRYPPGPDPIYHKSAALSYEFRSLGVASYHDPWYGFVDRDGP